MDQPIVQGLLTFLGGAVVAGLNALLSARLHEKGFVGNDVLFLRAFHGFCHASGTAQR